MYDTHVECTYHSEVFLETDNITEREKTFIRNCLYRQEFLNIFTLEEYDDFIIRDKLHELYEKLKENEDLLFCMKEIATKMNMLSDIESGMYILFSYDYLYLFHPCVCDFLENGKILNTHLNIKSILEKD
jgi:hypothetical protein